MSTENTYYVWDSFNLEVQQIQANTRTRAVRIYVDQTEGLSENDVILAVSEHNVKAFHLEHQLVVRS